jgi:hypothetical protein
VEFVQLEIATDACDTQARELASLDDRCNLGELCSIDDHGDDVTIFN